MEVVYKFKDIPGHDDDESHRRNIFEHGGELHSVLWDYTEWLRSQIKHGDMTEVEFAALELCSDKIWGLINEEGIGNLFG